MRKIRLSLAGLVAASLALHACSNGGNNGPAPPDPPPPPPPPTGGLDGRPQNLSCVAPDRTQGGASVTVVNAFPALSGTGSPTKALVEPGVADPRWFVLRKSGQLVVFDPDNPGPATTYLSIAVNSGGEGGLLGMAFHPDYPSTREIFLSYTVNGVNGNQQRSVISRVILDDVNSPSQIGAGSVEQNIIEIDQFQTNHNGGDIAFGPAPDNYLFIGLGDGGGGGDPQETGQDTTRLLGSMLRLDVLGPGVTYPTNPYDIPNDNPFFGNDECGPDTNADACPEIYAWGLRNPWRWSFDPQTDVLWLADVGQGAREEVDQIELGGNYGWDCREGTIAHSATLGCTGPTIDPIAEYDRSNGDRSITGGFVYRGTAIAGLTGRYVFGDFVSGRIWALQSDGQGGFDLEELVSTGDGVSSFAVDRDGELFYTAYPSGRIMQLVSSGGGGADPVPDLLSDSGCVAPADTTLAYSGLVPYEPNAPFWSDGAAKDRYIGLPDGTTISIDAGDDFVFPNGTILVKNFSLNGRLVETRHLMRHPDGGWAGYTYEWNLTETEATRVRGGKTVDIDGQDWIFPDEAECLQCHTPVAGVALGADTAQINKDFTYPSTGRTANQLETLDEVVMFSSPLPGPVDTLPSMADPADVSAPLGDRARAYLHTNCAQCHQPNGPTPVNVDLRYTTLLGNTNACDAVPQAGDVGLVNPRIILPGDAANSVLVARTALRDTNGMPPIASSLVDDAGVLLLSDWINSLTGCN